MTALDAVAAFVKVVGSAIAGGEPTFSVQGIGGFGGFDGDADDGDPGKAEQSSGQPGYSALGIIGRPLPPEGGLFAEAAALRIDGGLSPIGWRDMRLNRALQPAEGQLAFAGYGGAVLSHAMTDDEVGSRKANRATWYVPFDFDGNGVAQKAHTISIDPTPGASSISLAHADGLFVSMTEDTGNGPGIVIAVDGSTFLRMTAGELTLQAAKVMLKGNVYVGRQAEFGLPLLAGPASPPCPSLFVSPV